MNERASRHPEDRTMAAFIDGSLAPDELAAVSEHLRGCRDCRTIVVETARFEREEERAPAQRGRPAWWLAAVAAVVAIAVSIPVSTYPKR